MPLLRHSGRVAQSLAAVIPFFRLSMEIRRLIYTTHEIECLNCAIYRDVKHALSRKQKGRKSSLLGVPALRGMFF